MFYNMTWMSLKDDLIFLGLGLTIGIFGPTLAGYAGINLPWSTNVMYPTISFGGGDGTMATASAMEGEYYGYPARARAIGPRGRARAVGRPSRVSPGWRRTRRIRAMEGEVEGYEGEELSYAGSSLHSRAVGRTSVIVPRGAGRAVSSHTGNTIGYGGDLKASPPGAFQKLNQPALTQTVTRFVRS